MSDTKDLKDILERLKGEVGNFPEERRPMPAQPAPTASGRAFPERREEMPPRGFPRHETLSHRVTGDQPWHENKETVLFGMLASLVMCLGGMLSGYGYIMLVGAGAFALFSLVLFLFLLGYYAGFRRRAFSDTGLAERVDALSRRVETLSSRSVSAAQGNFRQQAASGNEGDMERKVEELRTMIKSLRKAMGLE